MGKTVTLRDENRRNWFRNGCLEFWQRTNAQAGITVQAYNTADRILQTSQGGTQITSERANDVPPISPLDYNIRYSIRETVVTPNASPAATDFYGPQYRMEGYDFNNLKDGFITLQFWAKSSIAGTYSFSISSGIDSSAIAYVDEYELPSAGVWYKIQKVIDLSEGYFTDITKWSSETGIGFFLHFCMGGGVDRLSGNIGNWEQNPAGGFKAGSSNNVNLYGTSGAQFWLAGFQINKGIALDAPLTLFGDTFDGEFEACQRYFEKTWDWDTPVGTATSAGSWRGIIAASSNEADIGGSYTVRKRAGAFMQPYNGVNGTINQIQVGGVAQAASMSGATGQWFLSTSNTGLASSNWNLHWTADAEL